MITHPHSGALPSVCWPSDLRVGLLPGLLITRASSGYFGPKPHYVGFAKSRHSATAASSWWGAVAIVHGTPA